MPLTTNPSDPQSSFVPSPHLITCKACGAQIAKNAKSCPVCGAKNKKPLYKKWWFWLCIVLTVGIIGGGNSQSAPAVSSPSRAQAPSSSDRAPASSSSAGNSASSASEEETNIFCPGDVLDTGRLKITYQECDSDWKGYSQYFGPQAGNKVVRAYFIFENIGSSDEFCSFAEFDCYADGVSAPRFLWSADDNLSTANLSPGRKLQGYIYYEVPANAEEIEVEYEISAWTQDKAIFVIE